MKSFRALLTIASLLLLSATTLSAQGQVACMDGSKSAGGRGACSGHGGIRTAARKAEAKADAKAAKAEKVAEKKAEVATAKADKKTAAAEKRAAAAEKKADKAEKKADKAESKAAMSARDDDHDARGATAECKDRTFSHAKSHQGACSRHGGVAKFLDAR